MRSLIALVLVISGLSFVGCLSEGDVPPVVVPRNTYQPSTVYYRSIDQSTLQIRWTRSVSDTQLNFKGYYVLLYTSVADTSGKANDVGSFDSTYGIPDTATVYKDPATGLLDTSCVFTTATAKNAFKGPGRYTAEVWGVRYPPQSKPDSLVRSLVFTALSFYNDPEPVVAPAAAYASSGFGATSVNLFWPRSASEKNPGFAGYIIRYIDTIKQSGAKLVYLQRVEKSNDSLKSVPRAIVSVPVNPQTLTFREYPYRFWIKAIRKDSVESDDSISITWSGAERIAQTTVRLDTGVFVGQVNTTFAVAQGPLTNPSIEFSFHYDGTNLSVTGLNGTKFATQTDTVALDLAYFAAPFTDADFSETSLTLPKPILTGPTFYALLPGGNRVRVQLVSNSNGVLVDPVAGTVSFFASFQPGFTGWPFF